MKHFSKIIALSLSLALLVFLIIPYAKPQTIIGDSIFPFEEDESFVWRCVNSTGPKHNIDDLTRFTIESIYNETFESVHCLMVNYSIDTVSARTGQTAVSIGVTAKPIKRTGQRPLAKFRNDGGCTNG